MALLLALMNGLKVHTEVGLLWWTQIIDADICSDHTVSNCRMKNEKI